MSFRSSHDQDHDTREHVSHDSNATPPTTWPLSQHASGHVPEARAHDITVSYWSSHKRKWRHAADTDAPSATATSSGARVSHEDNTRRAGSAVQFLWSKEWWEGVVMCTIFDCVFNIPTQWHPCSPGQEEEALRLSQQHPEFPNPHRYHQTRTR